MALGALLLTLVVACPLGLYAATARPAWPGGWWHSPVIFDRHILSVGLLPCSATTPGQLVLGLDLIISSRYPPPGLSLTTAPPCP